MPHATDPPARRAVARPMTWWVATGAAIVMAGFAAGAGPLITSTAGRRIRFRIPGNIGPQGSRPRPPPNRAQVLHRQRPTTPPDALHVVAVVLTILAIAGVLVILGFALRALVRRYGSFPDRDTDDDASVAAVTSGDAETAKQARAAVRQALDALDDESDPRRAVVACWLRFEAALRDQGMPPRHVAETATELAGRAATTYAVSPDLLHRLNQLFRAARYSSAPVSPQAPAAARAVLEEIRARLGRVPEPIR